MEKEKTARTRGGTGVPSLATAAGNLFKQRQQQQTRTKEENKSDAIQRRGWRSLCLRLRETMEKGENKKQEGEQERRDSGKELAPPPSRLWAIVWKKRKIEK